MNHLGVDPKMRVVFDSGDSKLAEEDEEEEDEAHQVVDIDHIRCKPFRVRLHDGQDRPVYFLFSF